MAIDFGGGSSRKDGWITVDMHKDADIIWDLNSFPYPIKSNSSDMIRFSHSLEHLKEPLKAMAEAYRIAKPKAIMEIDIPWWKLDYPNKNPAHLHWFHPDWFKNLDSRRPCWDSEYPSPCDWRFICQKVDRVWYFPLAKCGYHVWLIKKE
jgi:predicted SAM-dependent methyltransferase